MHRRTTGHAERVQIIELHQQGEGYHAIADETGLNYYTVRKWIRRYKKEGWLGIDPKQTRQQAKGALAYFDPLVKYVALRLKKANPGWGLDVLLLEMSRRESLEGHKLPSRTALYNYLKPFLHRFRQQRQSRTIKPKPAVAATKAVHQRWQIDFKGEVQTAAAGWVLPLNVCDEHSSAPLAGIIYTAAGKQPKKGLTTRDIQQALRELFTNWGRPEQLRMDRDSLWVGSTRLEWPGALLLWLVGLDITPVINRPGRPTDNAQIERLNRTWLEQVGLGATTASALEVQDRTDKAWRDRLFYLPSRNKHCQNQPPATRFPELFANPRPYSSEQEGALFEMQRVYDYLAQWQWQRKVDQVGCISLNSYSRSVSRKHAGQVVKVRFDATQHHFIASAIDGTELKRFTIPSICPDFIRGTGSWL